MDRESIRGFAIASRIMYEALDGKVDGERLANLVDGVAANPKRGIALLFQAALRNHALTEAERAEIAMAMDMVDSDVESGDLTREEQGDWFLDFMKARRPDGGDSITVSEAAAMAGVTPQAIRLALVDERPEHRIAGDKRAGRWAVDRRSVEAWIERRAARLAGGGSDV